MNNIKVKDIVKITKGELIFGNPEVIVTGYSIDSRIAEQDNLFFPLKGQNSDGHNYLDVIADKEAGFVFSQNNPRKGAFAIKVDDVLKALHDIAKYKREKLDAKVVAITGSTAKTSVKDLLYCVIKNKYKVFAAPKNFNTEIGLPLAILAAPGDTEVLILEMGMRGLGQIKLLSEIAKPDIGLVTNINKTHISLLGSEENIAMAKSELVSTLNEENISFLCAEDRWTPYLVEKAKCRISTFGMGGADVSAQNIELDEMAKPTFEIKYKDKTQKIKLNIAGKHSACNAVSAAAVALELGLSLEDIRVGLESAKLSDWRMQIKKANNLLLICDYYNASPNSLRAALDTLKSIKTTNRKVAILGDMLELGEISIQEHINVVKKANIIADEVILVGENMGKAVASSGLKIKTYQNANELKNELKEHIMVGDVILLKASRAMTFEVLAKHLLEGVKFAS